MALDKVFFDSIHIDVVKGKYYNVRKVEAVLAEIRLQAEEMLAENESLRMQLAEFEGRKVEIGDAVLSAQNIYHKIVDKANARADAILAEAERHSLRIVEETQRQQDYAIQRVERCFNAARKQHLAAIDSINAEWQDFLCRLYPEETAEEEAPEDLDEKVGAIAKELFSIEEE